MCYSARIKTNLKELSWEFRAQLDMDEFERLFQLRLRNPELKVPYGIDRYFLLSTDPAESRLGSLVRKFHASEKERAASEQKLVLSELAGLRAKKPGVTINKKIGILERRIAKIAQKLGHSLEQIAPLDDRIFPMYFAPVIAEENGRRRLSPMRYRIRNPDGSEIPSKYNVFNARLDSLLEARTWKPLFGKTHLIFPFQRFYEWVNVGEKKQEIYFAPKGRTLMWAAGLYSAPKKSDDLPYASFAMITDNPPTEVAAAGHDRCPVFLSADAFDEWLRPEEKASASLLAMLQSIEKPFYLHGTAA